jgi:hypothetical protein
MEHEMNLRDERVPVLLTKDERAEIQAAADAFGVPLSTYLRIKALEATRVKD